MIDQPLLDVSGLTLTLGESGRRLVSDVSFALQRGEVMGVVGESGSGKTLAARAIIRLEPPAIRRAAGTIRFLGHDLVAASPAKLRSLRGAECGLVFQEPMTSLNPSMLIGDQLEEGLIRHKRGAVAERRRMILDMLDRVGIEDPVSALRAYPHQFSGGMRQRIMLASVMLLRPSLLIADEPTTALDAIVQRDVLELMLALTRENGTAMLLISHDLPMVARYTTRIIVMREGEIVEQGGTSDILARPKHPYTRRLLAALPRRDATRPKPPQAPPLVCTKGLVIDYVGHGSLLRRRASKRALHGIDIEVKPKEVVAVVGGSGSGKTTLGRAIAGLIPATTGEITFNGRSVGPGRRDRDYRLNCQMIFQDPFSSLDPRMTVGVIVGQPLRLVPNLDAVEKDRRVANILDEVDLGNGYAARFPHELSGGQRQRVAIARALIRRPSFVVADEPVSALDVTVRAQVLEMFARMQRQYGFSCLFISHDLGVVEQIADRIIVLNHGRIVEEGDCETIFEKPRAPYTRKLLSAIPSLVETADGGVALRWRYGMDSNPVSAAAT